MIDAAETELVRATIRHLLSAAAPADVPAQLLAAGWGELLEADPAVAASVLAREQGLGMTATPSLDLVMMHGASIPLDSSTAFILPPLGRAVAADRAGDELVVEGLVLAGHDRAEHYLVPASDALLRVPTATLTFQPVRGTDPDLGLARAAGSLRTDRADGANQLSAWPAALAAGRRFLAAELLGLSERMLAETVSYVLARHQFGRPIASFQAVKHRLADVRVAVSGAQAGLTTAWADGDPVSAIAAKCLAGRAHRLASAHCHQVHGGIAFTVEHGFHRLIRRGQVLDGLLGSADELVSELGRHLIEARAVPRTPQLHDPLPA